MKNNQCKSCGLYYFQCKCNGRKGVPKRTGKRKKKEVEEENHHHHQVVIDDTDDTDNAISRINDAEREFFQDNDEL